MKKILFVYALFLFSFFGFAVDPINIILPAGQFFVGMDATFTIQNPDNTLVYQWSFDDGTPVQTGVSVIHSFKEPKTYKIRCAVQNIAIQLAPDEENFTVSDNRNMQIQGGPFMAGTEVNINTNNFVKNNLKWDFGDGSAVQNGSKNIKHIFQSPGTYTVKAFDFGGDTTTAITANVTIIADNRSISFSVQSVFVGQTVNCTASNFSSSNLKWDFGNGVKNGGNAIANKYTVAGNYTVKVSDLSNTSLGEITKTILVKPENRSIQINPNNPALYQSIDFTANNFTGSNIEWDFGDGIKKNGNRNISYSYSRKGQFKIIAKEIGSDRPEIEKMLAINRDIRQIEISPNRLNVGDFANIKLKNSTVNTMDWKIGNETKRNVQPTLRYQFIDPGNFEIISSIHGQSPIIKRITVYDTRKIIIKMRYLFEGINIEFDTMNFKGANLKWDFGDGVIKNGRNQIAHQYKRAGNYTVKVYDFNGKSKIPVLHRIRIISDKRKVTSVYKNSYTGTQAEFNAKGFIDNRVKWDFGDGTIITGNSSAKHTYKSPGSYSVKVVDMGGRGIKKIVKNIIVKRDTRKLSLPQKITAGVPVNLGLKGYLSGKYEWKFDDGSVDYGNSLVSKVFKRAGMVRVTLLDKLKNDPPLTKVIKIVPDKRSLMVSAKSVLPKKKVVFTALNFLGKQIKWDFGDGTSKISSAKSISHTYLKQGKYRVIASDFGGKGKKLFQEEILVSNILPGFKIETIEFKFNDGKYYKIVQKNQYKLGYKMRIKTSKTGLLTGKIIVDGMTLGLFEVFMNGNDVGYLKDNVKPKLPLLELGMHKLSFEFTNYKFSGQKPILRYFVTMGKSILLKTPKDNSILNASKTVKFVWTTPYKYLDYEYSFSAIPFQFLNDRQIKWKKSDTKNSFLLDYKKFKKTKFGYLIIRAKDKNDRVKTVSQIYSFRIK